MNHTRDPSRVHRVLRRRREGAKRGRNERERCRSNLINGDIDTTMLFFLPRVNITGTIFTSLLNKKPSSPPFFRIILFSIPLRSSSRELVFFQVEILSLSPSLLFFTFIRTLFSEAKGRDPAVSKYDTGIGYKETINHTQARVNGTRPLRETLSGRFLRGYLDGQTERKKEREREEEGWRE